MKKLLEFIISGIIGGILISLTASEIRVDDKTDFTLLTKSVSFWILVLLVVLIITFLILKSYIFKKIAEYINKLEDTIIEKIEKNIQAKIQKNIKTSVTNSLRTELRREVKETKREIKEDNDTKIDNIISNLVKPLIIVEVRKEVEVIQMQFSEKIELTVLKYFINQQTPNQQVVTVDQLSQKYNVMQASEKEVVK